MTLVVQAAGVGVLGSVPGQQASSAGSLWIRASSWLLHRSGIFQDSQNDLRFPDLGLAGRYLVLSLRRRGSAGISQLVGGSLRDAETYMATYTGEHTALHSSALECLRQVFQD